MGALTLWEIKLTAEHTPQNSYLVTASIWEALLISQILHICNKDCEATGPSNQIIRTVTNTEQQQGWIQFISLIGLFDEVDGRSSELRNSLFSPQNQTSNAES